MQEPGEVVVMALRSDSCPPGADRRGNIFAVRTSFPGLIGASRSGAGQTLESGTQEQGVGKRGVMFTSGAFREDLSWTIRRAPFIVTQDLQAWKH